MLDSYPENDAGTDTTPHRTSPPTRLLARTAL